MLWLGVLVSSPIDRGFIGGVMVSVLVSSLIDLGFIGGAMDRRSRLESGRSWVHRWCNGSAYSSRVWWIVGSSVV